MKIVFDLIKRTFYKDDGQTWPPTSEVPPVMRRIDPPTRLDKMTPEEQEDFWRKRSVLDQHWEEQREFLAQRLRDFREATGKDVV